MLHRFGCTTLPPPRLSEVASQIGSMTAMDIGREWDVDADGLFGGRELLNVLEKTGMLCRLLELSVELEQSELWSE